MKRLILIFALAAIVALPFLLRPKQAAAKRADQTVVVVTSNNEAIRHEFGLGFEDWYRARTGKTVYVDWRVLGGTSEIARYLEGAYVAAFQNYWTGRLGRPWSFAVQAAFQNPRLAADAPADAREARTAFLASQVGSGIDVFFGGGSPDFDQQAAAGRLVASDVVRRHPDWFTDAVLPERNSGEEFRDAHNLWFGSVISCYGIIYNRDALRRLRIEHEPTQWTDLSDPRYLGEVALCDPTKSGSIAMAFENVIQQQMQRRLKAGAGDAAVREGWEAALRLIQLIGANARYFTDSSQKPPIDVADGNCAAGMCIDFYGTEQVDAVRRRGDSARLGFAIPVGGTAYSVDPIGLMRGAPNRAVGDAFIEYVLSLEGQKLWGFQVGAPGGPREFNLGRLPIRRDFYSVAEWKAWRDDPRAAPYDQADPFIYHPEWTGRLFREIGFIIRIMCQDTHGELVRAWKAILAAPEPARSRALAALQDMTAVSYDRADGEITRALNSRDQVDEIRFANALAARFRGQYTRAEALARSGN